MVRGLARPWPRPDSPPILEDVAADPPSRYVADVLEPVRAMQTPARRLTADDAWHLQREDPDVHGYELVDGELVEVTSSTWPHGRMMVEIGRHLGNHVAKHAGVRLLWVIYPEARYAVAYRPDGAARLLRERESLDGEDVLPGFHLPLDRIFD